MCLCFRVEASVTAVCWLASLRSGFDDPLEGREYGKVSGVSLSCTGIRMYACIYKSSAHVRVDISSIRRHVLADETTRHATGQGTPPTKSSS